MKSPRAVWEGCAEDQRWLDNQVAMIDEIMRDAFAAGFAAGADLGARSVDAHLDAVASNLAVRVPASVPNGLRALTARLREIGQDTPTVLRAWHEAIGAPRLGLQAAKGRVGS